MNKKVHNTRTKTSRDDWITPREIVNFIEYWFDIYFTLDPCATKENRKCNKYFTKEQNGLIQSWQNQNLFINPPFNEKDAWIDKIIEELKKALKTDDPFFAALLMPSTTDTKWFEKIYQNAYEIIFLTGRIQFLPKNKVSGNNLGSMVCVFSNKYDLEENEKPLMSLVNRKDYILEVDEFMKKPRYTESFTL